MYYTKKQNHKVLPKDKKQLREVLDEKVAEFLNDSSEIQKVRKGFSGQKKKRYDDTKEMYHNYVTKDSNRWKKKKEEAFRVRGRHCQICESTEDLQVHHNNYRLLLVENVEEDLVVLCKGCHHHFHSHIPAKNLGTRHEKTNCSFCSSGKKPKFAVKFRKNGGPWTYMCHRCQEIFKKRVADTDVVAEIESNMESIKKQKEDRLILREQRKARPLMKIRKSKQSD